MEARNIAKAELLYGAIDATGRITPQTVTLPMRPVMSGPPKFATVVIHSSANAPLTSCGARFWRASRWLK